MPRLRRQRRGPVSTTALLAGLVLASGAMAPTAAAQSGPDASRVRLYVLADTVALGEAFEVAVAADHAPGVQVLFPAIPLESTPEAAPLVALGDAEATDLRRFAPRARGRVQTDSVVYRALAFTADSAMVSVSVRFASGADTTEVTSASREVRVRRLVPGPDAEPEPPAEPFAFPDPRPVWALLSILGLAVLTLAGWGLWRLWKKPARQRPTPRARPYPEALARLDALAASPPTPEASQAWFVELADALRVYLERRVGVPARERTTREIDATLASRLPDEPRAAFRGALRAADRVKFADLRPGPEASGDVLTRARTGLDAVEAHLKAQEEAAREAAEATQKSDATP
ncbi:hypothetical protein [Rubricoccus marinus]|uniref:DUF4381 domain-containing protein n=1 Tax=Rubricoccus marinus TaxID=716817 RepID=A0A259U1E4_9BACT|nr:hypothetical protein [Rubricoccus marinus]OZC03667.1 hypothetical protein BSZ36_12160 [Rubricoccus marinus]